MTQRMVYDPERVITKMAEQLAAAHARIAKLEVVLEDQAEQLATAHQPEQEGAQ